MPKRIPIAEAKRVAEAHGLRQVVLLGFDGERTHIVTYGVTKADCDQAATAQQWWSGKTGPEMAALKAKYEAGQ